MSDPEYLASCETVLLKLGLTTSKATDLSRNKDALARLMEIIERAGLMHRDLSPRQASLIASLAESSGSLEREQRSYVLRHIVEAQISVQTQLTEAVGYLRRGGNLDNDAAFCDACGAGISFTREEIRLLVEKQVQGRMPVSWDDLRKYLATLKLSSELRWADPPILKEETEAVFLKHLGPRPDHIKTKTNTKTTPKQSNITSAARTNIFEEGFLASLHKPGENPQVDDRLRVEHLKATGGKVITRFPPEPNGHLHIGHAKAIAINFGYAAYHGGLCYLRYDDTNPSKEERAYFDSILTAVRWLGIEPDKVTYSSDYFDILFEKAIELIKKDKAYVCQCTYEERGQGRGANGKAESRQECEHRRRPIDESLAMFEQMKNGHPDTTNATLRMKQDLADPNPQMWDLLAYRAHSDPHPRTGTQWNIYPTYDYTHCLVDSIENISHSLCTSEFIASRQSYEWLCHALEIYTPRQYEYGRLSLNHTVMSKRRLHRLIQGGRVTGWDDIRLPTLVALRRRGVPPDAILQFVRGLGVTTAMAVTDLVKFDEFIRQYLEPSAPRLFLILRPVKVVIENISNDFLLLVEKPYHPKYPSMGAVSLPFTRVIYIDAEDFRISGSKDYLRLIPGGSVGLLHVPHPITCTSFETDSEGNVRTISARYHDTGPAVKPKAYIQWVADCPAKQSPVRVNRARLVGPLFKSANPPNDEQIDEHSLEVLCDALIEVGFWEVAKTALDSAREGAQMRISETKILTGISPITEDQVVGPECVRFQATRVGYFSLDSDSNIPAFGVGDADNAEVAIVLNRIVSLKAGGSRPVK
ncbi:glutaminyl-tRNA synthetase [Mycena sp. CBHHK59/15]|nr:glutaminyl-tRNA synthetase [Mycena sp. CBHHK59/15]